MDPRRVLTFRAVAHERSFSAAARTLALTQPAVSQQVAALEKEVGARLLDREPGGLKLTRAGAVLLEHADALADRLALARTQLAESSADVRLRMGAFPSALAALVPKAVARAPRSSQVLVEEGSTPELAERVRRGELHLAVGFQDAAQPRREHEGTVREDLAREPFLVALWPEHPLAELEAVPAGRARRRALGGAEQRRPDRPRLPGRRLRSAAADALARRDGQPRARRARASRSR